MSWTTQHLFNSVCALSHIAGVTLFAYIGRGADGEARHFVPDISELYTPFASRVDAARQPS
jgi:hypothetical protein